MWAELRQVVGLLGFGGAVALGAIPAPTTPTILATHASTQQLGISPSTVQRHPQFHAVTWHANLQQDLLRIAHNGARSSLAVRTEQARISAGKARLVEGMRDLLPALTFDFEDSDGKLFGGRYKTNNYRLDFRQPLFRGGTLWHQAQAARARVHAYTHAYTEAVNTAQLEAAAAYLRYYASIATTEDFEALHTRIGSWDHVSEQTFSVGITSKIESLTSQAVLAQLSSEYFTRRSQTHIRETELRSALGLDLHAPIPPASTGSVEHLVQALLDERPVDGVVEELLGHYETFDHYVQLALGHRPELLAATFQADAARHSEHIALGQLLPQVDVVGSWGKRAEAFVETTKDAPHENEWFAGLSFTWQFGGSTITHEYQHQENAPSVTQFSALSGTRRISNHISVGVLDALDSIAESREGRVQSLEADQELDTVRRAVLSDVSEAYYGVQQAQISWQAVRDQLPLQRRLRQLAEHRYAMHEIELSDVVQAELGYAMEVERLRAALIQVVLARWQLLQAAGTLHLTEENPHAQVHQ